MTLRSPGRSGLSNADQRFTLARRSGDGDRVAPDPVLYSEGGKDARPIRDGESVLIQGEG